MLLHGILLSNVVRNDFECYGGVKVVEEVLERIDLLSVL